MHKCMLLVFHVIPYLLGHHDLGKLLVLDPRMLAWRIISTTSWSASFSWVVVLLVVLKAGDLAAMDRSELLRLVAILSHGGVLELRVLHEKGELCARARERIRRDKRE